MNATASENHTQPESVLVLRFSAVGDVLLTTPALDALHTAWPNTRIIFGTKAFIGDMIRHHPAVSEVVGLNRGESAGDYAKRLRATNFTRCLDLHDKLRSRILNLLTPGRPFTRWHNRSSLDNIAIALGLKSYRAPAPTADLFHRAVEKLVGRELPRGRMHYAPGPGDVSQARDMLKEAGADFSRPIIGMAAGANWATKRWPAEYFRELVGMLLNQGYQIALNGGPGERELSASIADGRAGVLDFTGATLAEMGAITLQCTAFVANDSGPMHLARACGVPSVAIFGSTDPAMFEYEGHALAYNHDLECSPCSFYGRKACPQQHFRCMVDLRPDGVRDQLVGLVNGRTAPLAPADRYYSHA